MTLPELRLKLRQISSGNHQWEARLIPQAVRNREGTEGRYAAIAYTNPELIDMPNYICYLFPVIEPGEGGRVRVCLHPSTAIPVAEGLYFEGAELRVDHLEDWGRFWDPLKAALA